MKNVIVIGGTGIIGKPIVSELTNSGDFKVYSFALDRANFPQDLVEQYVIDRRTAGFKTILNGLNEKVGKWDSVIDICAFGEESGKDLVESLTGFVDHFITITTTLVYDRSQKTDQSITEDVDLAQEVIYGGYVDGKVRLEKFWQSQKVNWTLLRPYHILGEHSLLGCIPYHNRDPKLLDLIKGGHVLKLVKGGETRLSFIHPKDIALAIVKIIGNEKTYKQAYNLVHPESILAKDYYIEIGKQLGREVVIEPVSVKEVWDKGEGWEMTTLPHVYSSEKLKNDIDFVASVSLSQAIADSIATYPAESEELPMVHQRMNRPPKPTPPDWVSEF